MEEFPLIFVQIRHHSAELWQTIRKVNDKKVNEHTPAVQQEAGEFQPGPGFSSALAREIEEKAKNTEKTTYKI